jgi:hypothetical protein
MLSHVDGNANVVSDWTWLPNVRKATLPLYSVHGSARRGTKEALRYVVFIFGAWEGQKRQYALPKYLKLFTFPHSVTTNKAWIFELKFLQI